ncbi:MAG TPA: EF-Tu/IF-2/RF-3 family GTPase, partial [Planctomicrobium sp.]|nr:EF-Tu/IF-2/RF-3 family GTPase [Planctomicrobium sp.]
YLDGETISREELDAAITQAIVAGTLIPVFCTTVKQDIGVSELMTAMARYAPNPHQIHHQTFKDGEEIQFDANPEGPLLAQVVKTRMDPFLSKVSYVRVYSGTLRKESNVHIVGTSRTVRIHHLADVQGGQYQNVDDAIAGDLVAITRQDDLQTGDVLSDGSDSITLPPMVFPRPMVGVAVEPKSQSDQARISMALNKIREEDPTFRVHREEQTHEIVMEGMSELHLQLIQNRLHQREKVDIITHPPKVPYRETIQGVAEGSYRHKKQSGGSGQFAEVHLRISPCPQKVVEEEYFTKEMFPNLRSYHYDPEWNFCFIDRVSGGSVPNQFIPAVEKGVRERMAQGGVAGCQMQDLVVELFFGKDHPVDSNEMAFKIAANHCLKELFLQAKPVLLEPIVSVEITVPTERIGEVTGDLNSRRGRMEGMSEAPGRFTVIQAKVPLSEMAVYARSLSSMTAGQGSFTMEFACYDPIPPHEQQKVIAAHRASQNGNSNGNGHAG